MNAKLCQLVQLIGTLLLAIGIAYWAAELFKQGLHHSLDEERFVLSLHFPILPIALAASGSFLWLVASRRVRKAVADRE